MGRVTIVSTFGLLVLVSVGLAQTQKQAPDAKTPQVTGDWTGTWGLYAPPIKGKEGEAAPKPALPDIHFQMTCKVTAMGKGKYEATFEGNAGRPYKFVIKMPGRQVGNVAMFSGTVDLGEKDGGVYDWIGKATEKEFIGFFTSSGYTGSFRLERPQLEPKPEKPALGR
jgi:hypothetical protein